MKCAALAKHVCCVLTALPDIHWDSLFTWTGNDKVSPLPTHTIKYSFKLDECVLPQLFAECVKLLQSAAERPEHTHLSLLLCCASLERALGDVSSLTSVSCASIEECVPILLFLQVYLSISKGLHYPPPYKALNPPPYNMTHTCRISVSFSPERPAHYSRTGEYLWANCCMHSACLDIHLHLLLVKGQGFTVNWYT